MWQRGGSNGTRPQLSIYSGLALTTGFASMETSLVALQRSSGLASPSIAFAASLPGLSVLSIDMDSMAVIHALNCRFEDKLVVQRLWTAISGQLQTCSDCVNAYHAAQVIIVILQWMKML